MAIYILGIPTFLLYFSIGMLAGPLSVLSSLSATTAARFSTGPVVQYVEVSLLFPFHIGGTSLGPRGVSHNARVIRCFIAAHSQRRLRRQSRVTAAVAAESPAATPHRRH